MALLLARGVESAKAELAVMKKALGLIGAAGFADDGESLQRDDGELVLQLAARLVLKGKGVEQALADCLRTDGLGALSERISPFSAKRLTKAFRGAGFPAPPDLLDPAVLRTMPPRVAAFMLYEHAWL